MRKINLIENAIKNIQDLDFVEEAFLDSDCAPEGFLSVQIGIKEKDIDAICKELGYDIEEEEIDNE